LSDKLRVHILSKELGVTSKAIIAKCKSEGIEGITNHMSTVSAGLAETIREWFSEGMHTTSVETSAPVDLEKARVKKRRAPRKKKTAEEEKPEAAVAEKAAKKDQKETEVAVAETPAAVITVPETPPAEPAPKEQEPPAETKPELEPAESQRLKPAAVIKAPDKPTSKKPAKKPAAKAPKQASPEKPKVKPTKKKKAKPQKARPAAEAAPLKIVAPAGPQNVPAPAIMRGPKVVGFAKPEPLPSPISRSTIPSDIERDTTPPSAAASPKTTKRRSGGLDEIDSRKSRHRANPRRSGRSALDVGERLKEWNDRDLLERQERLQAASGKGIHSRRAKEKASIPTQVKPAPRKTKAQVNEPIVVHELCAATGIGMNQLWPKFKNEHDMLIQRNTVIPTDLVELVMLDYGIELEVIKPKTELEKITEKFETLERNNLKPRPPVVTMLGHVDHGKTSLLDYIRQTSVASGEAGGITQKTSAYRVQRGDLSVTFLDTPGHEAFTSMRARGANMTDVVVLVVAVDDGVMPQTIEAINHAKAAEVMIVIALNKIDLPGVDINKVYGQLAEHELAPTEWGGQTDVIKTSAITGDGVENLIAHLATLTELLDLKADPTLPASGTVIEALVKPGIGPSAQLLVREGTLKEGNFIVCGPGAGRVRMMRNDLGRRIKTAGPGVPVEIAGLDEVPKAGDAFYCLESLQQAKIVAEETKQLRHKESLSKTTKPQSLQDLLAKRESGERPELNLILRADIQGSIDALTKSLADIPDEEVKLNILHSGIGSITESDVVLAEASGALIVGFNVVPESGAQSMAESKGVDIRQYRVIYDIIGDIRKALEGLLPSEQSEESRGKAQVREIFHVSRVGTVAGCMVTDGNISRTHFARIIRDGQIIIPTEEDVKRRRHREIVSLRRFKDDVREVRAGMECGLKIADFDDVKPGDIVETYEVIETARTL